MESWRGFVTRTEHARVRARAAMARADHVAKQ